MMHQFLLNSEGYIIVFIRCLHIVTKISGQVFFFFPSLCLGVSVTLNNHWHIHLEQLQDTRETYGHICV